MSYVTTHVLDTARGRPGTGIALRLERVAEPSELVAAGVTDDDGRVDDLGPDSLPVGTYRLRFDTAAYFAASGDPGFFPTIEVTFSTLESEPHYHVPLLLSPFAYSTYRGS